MVKIKIKPKTVAELEVVDERQRERQDACYEEIQSLRCEMEMMKTAMDDMKRRLNEMQKMQLQSGYSRCEYAYTDVNARGDNVSSAANFARSDFSVWISGLELTLQDLEKMFESSDVVDWACKIIVADLKQRESHPYPICAIKGSRNEMMVYDNSVWRKLTDLEFSSTIMNKVFKKLLAAFTGWKNENYNRILTSEQFSTLYHSNYARILSFNENASKLKMKLFHML